MIILLTAPTGTGKTNVSWTLLPKFNEMTFLDCDWFVSRLPFSWDKPEDLATSFQALALMIEFHLSQGRQNFVITMTLQMAEHFDQYRHYFEKWNLPIHAFRLHCDESELTRRIQERDRIEWQKQDELQGAPAAQRRYDELFPDNSVFQLIDTTHLTEEEVAVGMLKLIPRSLG